MCILLVIAPNLRGASGTVETSDGKKLVGEIRLENGGVIVADTNQVVRIDLARISLLRFQSPPPPVTSSATGLVHGLRGTYFSNHDLTGQQAVRIDPTVNFLWQRGSPAPGIGPGPFSVRWEGQIKAVASGRFTFYIVADGGVRFWVNQQLLIDTWEARNLPKSNAAVDLEADHNYDLKLEYFTQSGGAVAQLYWTGPSVPGSIIPAQFLYTTPGATAVPEPTGRPITPPTPPAGVLLTSGSVIGRRIASADDTSVRFFDATNEITLSTINVARIYFQALPAELESQLRPGRAGLFLSSKEFVEGEFKSFSDGQIKINSVLFGLKTYDPGQVIAVILREPKRTPTRYELRTRDQSFLLVNALRIENDSIVLQDSALAGCRIASNELVELLHR
jgi:hypothetical protein